MDLIAVSSGCKAFLSSIKSPKLLSSSSPTGVSRDTGSFEIFKTFRAWYFELKLASLLPEHREKMKETVIWNIESGMKLSGPELGRAEVKRTALFHRVREFMQNYDFLALPVSQVPPFQLEQEYVSEINGMKMETYLDWMRSCYYITVTGQPAISVPSGFNEAGLPVGLQLVEIGRASCRERV